MKASGIISRLQFSSKSYWAAEYTYRLDKEKLTDYSLEQQASILADHWLLLVYGISKWSYYQRPGCMGMYRGVKHEVQNVAGCCVHLNGMPWAW